jgi:hypothetical protein
VASPYTVITVSVLSSGSLATRSEHLGFSERFCKKKKVSESKKLASKEKHDNEKFSSWTGGECRVAVLFSYHC